MAIISMPDEMPAFKEARVSDLIRYDREETERLLLDGVESGITRPLDMADLKKRNQTFLNQSNCSR